MMERALEEREKVEHMLEGTPPSRVIVATFLAGGARRTWPKRQEGIVDDARDVWELVGERRHARL
jgi:hypothetical protein